MKQMTLATAGFERYAKTTRRAEFLAQMDRVVPWERFAVPAWGCDVRDWPLEARCITCKGVKRGGEECA